MKNLNLKKSASKNMVVMVRGQRNKNRSAELTVHSVDT